MWVWCVPVDFQWFSCFVVLGPTSPTGWRLFIYSSRCWPAARTGSPPWVFHKTPKLSWWVKLQTLKLVLTRALWVNWTKWKNKNDGCPFLFVCSLLLNVPFVILFLHGLFIFLSWRLWILLCRPLQVLRNKGIYESVKFVQQENFWIGPSSVRFLSFMLHVFTLKLKEPWGSAAAHTPTWSLK